ncbi:MULTISPECIES: XRE family transcriptional regulator [Proteus]|uniref:XRE family transcriptional regulator n=1 Tax=Proteus TaxID=583 RepID=UPI0013770114|nr:MULTISPECIES: XRE family transcriptional regulator [Proteus]MDK6829323.1 XRE family transcriptional regulator [Proteus mirabilis]MDK7833328.1 XRE family transcriptional regulator [Proteus mirabilis]MDK8634674.1 XRE family transcriptional regulator [Proteus mirabilis]NBN47720.1 ImmA/IrrE family metallo-endopeptidase [Proteus sp. G2626]WPD00508.1 XRE family transcriptional regulator [Proteus terrae]
MSSPNPKMLKWAREQAGLNLHEAAKKLGLKSARFSPEEVLMMFELGEKVPTQNQLGNFAKVYHRPLISFYLEKPPVIANKGDDFRTLYNAPDPLENATVNTLIRDVHVRQKIVKEALIDSDSAISLPFIGTLKNDTTVSEAASFVIDTFKIDISTYRKQKDAHSAFNFLRNAIEDNGIFVLLIGNLGSHHSNISVNYFRGFALSDPIAPFIVINDNDSKYAWCFTLLHELVHLLIGNTGISNASIDNLVEKYCNDIASQVLISDDEFKSIGDIHSLPMDALVENISELSIKFNVSSSMIAYRLFTQGKIDKNNWEYISDFFLKKWLASKEENNSGKSSGAYYPTKRHKVGKALSNLVKRSIIDGVLTETKASKVLGVSSGNVIELVGL